MSRGSRWCWAGPYLGVGLGLSVGCGAGDEPNSPPVASQTEGMSESDDTDPDDGESTTAETGDTGDTTGTPGTNCGDIVCNGHGACEIDDDGVPQCVCDPHYVLDAATDECVVDETCIEVRYLEDRCRQIFDGPPAVSLFFAVDFCAGTAVLPEDIERLGLSFLVLEDGTDIAKNVESDSTIIDKGVESYVTLAIDVSDSVEATGDLPALVDELRAFVESLAPAPGEADVYVSLDVFGADVAEYVPFTRDFAAVDAALAAISADFAAVSALAGGGMGTDLYDAVAHGIHRTDRVRKLKDAVTWGGVLTTGTVVVVTDGINSTGGTLDAQLIEGTTNQVISIGISDDIDDATLQEIGRDGSFLAPTVDEWAQSFAEIAVRIDQYPERSYLLGYCSSLNEGTPTVEVKVLFPDRTTSRNGAVCHFLPSYFGSDLEDQCTGEYFATECAPHECGGITACGACSEDECCTGSQCEPAQSAADLGISCDDQDELCAVDEQICASDGECRSPAAEGEPCDPGCDPGATYCGDDGTCTPALGLGEACDAPDACMSLHCGKQNPDSPFDENECLPPVEMYESCGDDLAICEAGTYCAGSTCEPRLIEFESCGEGEACRRGQCTSVEGQGQICRGAPACFWSWGDKF